MEVISADPSSLCVYLFHHSNIPMCQPKAKAGGQVRYLRCPDLGRSWNGRGVSRRADEKAPAVKPRQKSSACAEGDARPRGADRSPFSDVRERTKQLAGFVSTFFL